MFGMMEALLSFLRRQVGLRTDAASATGSLHAKVAELRSYVNSQVTTVQKPRRAISGSFSTSQDTYQQALNISGKGRLVAIKCKCTTSASNSDMGIKITIDGTKIVECKSAQVSTTTTFYPTNDFLWVTDGSANGLTSTITDGNVFVDLSFNTSLLIEIKKVNSTNNTVSVNWVYEVES